MVVMVLALATEVGGARGHTSLPLLQNQARLWCVCVCVCLCVCVSVCTAERKEKGDRETVKGIRGRQIATVLFVLSNAHVSQT